MVNPARAGSRADIFKVPFGNLDFAVTAMLEAVNPPRAGKPPKEVSQAGTLSLPARRGLPARKKQY